MKDIRHKLYPAIIAMLMVALGASLLSRWQISIETEPAATPSPEGSEAIAPSPTPIQSPTPSPTAVEPSPSSSPSPPGGEAIAPTSSSRIGSLRVSNRTAQPLRVALLPAVGGQYREPVQWDFAPEEGSDRGLKLSLPEGDLQVRDGDVLVAFAQDGSRRYWGPYVLGKTNLPRWVSASREWQLVLQPE
ncbi:hypothetical protein H6F67_13250 [Microcoleus sp. FACHB-1515]|uniref:hypothetical protein n=1 Tax=Cyanophyceae TaxID=3028117 RepID=UPI00168983A0|nr:hypothetical protein [Microcoleus sp. FACHB-1515]MBD2090817.1 hypothetical protein [Microcoleus sp. FACHB-1515]